ncbi:MAG: hypothetical protein AAGN66_09315 [Acidobacteriota bacterium]
MKALGTLISLALALGLATVVVAGEDDGSQKKTRMHVVVGGEGQEVFELDDLEVGESRQILTDSGAEIVATRSEEGLEVVVDGETIQLFGDGGAGDLGAVLGDLTRLHVGHDGGNGKQVVIKTLGTGGAGNSHVQVWADGDDTGDGTKVFRYEIDNGNALEHLRESGVLDELDEDTRRKVEEALETYGSGASVGKRVIVIGGDDDEAEVIDL